MDNPEVLKWLIIGSFSFLIVLVFAIGAKCKWFSSISINKDKLEIKAKEENKIEIEKRFQSGSLNHLMDCEINNLDNKLVDFAIERSRVVRRAMALELKTIGCHSTRKALASDLRFPLYEVSRKNNFKYNLLPENIKEYVDNLIKKMVYEYQEFAIEREMSWCPINNEIKCPDIPSLDELLLLNKKQLIEDWALPNRDQTIKICKEKIEVYEKYITLFEELGDQVKIKICIQCIDKNKSYIKNLTRKPDKEIGEF